MAALLTSARGQLGGGGRPGLVVGPGGGTCQVGVPQEWTRCGRASRPVSEHRGSQDPSLQPGVSGPSWWGLTKCTSQGEDTVFQSVRGLTEDRQVHRMLWLRCGRDNRHRPDFRRRDYQGPDLTVSEE